jgi:hypothetical protein
MQERIAANSEAMGGFNCRWENPGVKKHWHPGLSAIPLSRSTLDSASGHLLRSSGTEKFYGNVSPDTNNSRTEAHTR